ncbi:hypothetical protein PY093_02935 [Cytobacillus sp. S13-E01]|uniref:hypothetical protein n=1 Tax=Cytobacillus sp. S13-E01 TaxID=3031326 RepID=UPI0023D896EE|nr:hypothetical protein [Cytobacillus sp. S13-E01]MDF0725669.1 hypothetical protein [Cytobacillus sp. S13-E01]
MINKAYTVKISNNKNNNENNGLINILDSEKFDSLLEKFISGMFWVILVVGVPYFIYFLSQFF